MKKFTEICAKFKFGMESSRVLSDLAISCSEISSKYIDGELYVDEIQLLAAIVIGVNPIPMLKNIKVEDVIYLDNCGLIDGSDDSFLFLSTLNQLIEEYGDNYEINPLMKNFSSITFHIDDNTIADSFYSLGDTYKEYVTHLINSIHKIDLSSIDIRDVINFELSDETKIFSTQKINFTDLKQNEKAFSINEENFINYLLHILPQYLPSDVKFHLSVIKIINYNEDYISVLFRDTLWKKSHQYVMDMKTNI